MENGSALKAGWSLISGGAIVNQPRAHFVSRREVNLRFEANVATKLALKR